MSTLARFELALLLGTIRRRRRRRQHFTDPVRWELERGRVGQLGHPRTPPAGDVGDQNVSMEVELGLVQEDPAARAAATAIERAVELCAEP